MATFWASSGSINSFEAYLVDFQGRPVWDMAHFPEPAGSPLVLLSGVNRRRLEQPVVSITCA